MRVHWCVCMRSGHDGCTCLCTRTRKNTHTQTQHTRANVQHSKHTQMLNARIRPFAVAYIGDAYASTREYCCRVRIRVYAYTR